jgi:hypothetical protein
MSLPLKYRPQSLDEVIGQEAELRGLDDGPEVEESERLSNVEPAPQKKKRAKLQVTKVGKVDLEPDKTTKRKDKRAVWLERQRVSKMRPGLFKTGKHQGNSAYQVAQVYAPRAEADLAFAWLEWAYAQRDPGPSSMKVDPLFRALHADPRWGAFLRKMGFAD